MLDRLTAAQVFVETVDRGSATAAAEALGMSRAMTSRYITALEDWTGTRLLHRTTRRLSLTSAGEQVLELAREMIRLGAGLSAVAEDGGGPQGLLRVAASTILSEERLTPLMADFLRLHPKLAIDLRASDRPVNLVEERIDVAIRIGSKLDPGYVARKLMECGSVLCASQAYLAQRGWPTRPADLKDHACLTFTNFGEAEWRLEMAGERATVKVSGPFRSNEALALRKVALAGLGIAMLPDFAVEAHLNTGALIAVLPGWRIETMPIHALYLSRSHLPASARAFIDYLAKHLPVGPPKLPPKPSAALAPRVRLL